MADRSLPSRWPFVLIREISSELRVKKGEGKKEGCGRGCQPEVNSQPKYRCTLLMKTIYLEFSLHRSSSPFLHFPLLPPSDLATFFLSPVKYPMCMFKEYFISACFR